jgi:hypothetical protein
MFPSCLGIDPFLAPLLNSRKPVLECVHVAWRSAAALYSCHKCVCFSLEFDSHDVRDPMIAETARRGNSCSRRRVIRFCASSRHSKHMQSRKNPIYFLGLAAEQRIRSPLLLSFDCACPSPLCRGWVQPCRFVSLLTISKYFFLACLFFLDYFPSERY